MFLRIQIFLWFLLSCSAYAQCTDELLLQLSGSPIGRIGGGQVKAALTPDGGRVLTGTFNESESVLVGDSLFSDTEGGGYGIFVIRTSSDGAILWARFFDGSGFNNVADVAVDGSGNTHITGLLANGLNIEGVLYNGAALQSFYLLKLDADGMLDWIKLESQSFSGGKKIILHGDLILVTGHFGHNLSITGTTIQASTQDGRFDAFVWAVDVNGNHQWITILNGAGTQIIGAIDCDNGRCVVAGSFETELSFDQSLISTTSQSDLIRYFIFAFDFESLDDEWFLLSTSEHQPIQSFEDIAIDGNDVYAYGRFRVNESLVFNQIALTSSGVLDAFILKVGLENGLPTSGRAIGGGDNDGPTDLAVVNNSIYALLSTYSTFSLDGLSIQNLGSSDVVLLKLKTDLSVVCLKQFGGVSYDDAFILLVSDSSTLEFNVFGVSQGDLTTNDMSLVTQGFMDGFLWKTCLPCDTLVSIAETTATQPTLHIYPNPASQSIRVEVTGSTQPTAITITDMLGHTVLHQPTQSHENNINISGLANGIYALTATLSNGETRRERLVVQH